jgi:hypothetical protein
MMKKEMMRIDETEEMDEEQMRRFVDLIKQHCSLGGYETIFTDVGYDAYGVFHLAMQNKYADDILWISKKCSKTRENTNSHLNVSMRGGPEDQL